MTDCRNIEALIHLYREGELSEEERAKVRQHTESCARCYGVLQQLRSIEGTLMGLRQRMPQLSGHPNLAADTIFRLSGKTMRRSKREEGRWRVDIDEVLGWLRPALSLILIAACILFVVQQSRDAAKVRDLESRLRARGTAMASLYSAGAEDADRLQGIVSSAAAGANPMDLFGSAFTDLFRRNRGLFEDLARRYPNLSGITVSDGLDERERRILVTEGKAFMKMFEQLVSEGER